MPLRAPAQRPTLLLTLVAIAIVATCLRLCWWQLERAQGKRRLHDALIERSRASPLALNAAFRYREALRFRAVTARGFFEPGAQIYLDNQVRDGRPGALLVTPFRIEHGGPRVLVLRGWVPWSADRTRLPPAPAPAGLVEIAAVLDAPPAHSGVLGDAPAAAYAGAVWPWLDEAAMQRRAGAYAAGFVLRQSGADEAPLERTPVVVEDKRAMHLAYAVQWAALALLAGLIYLRLLRGPRDAGVARAAEDAA
ncbi:MAG TPA: SURF1 family protein [Gammaproteobacteria bacterium]|nr:SURF1 family protein [Gammaproteobacteria bacterium]